MYKQVHGKSLKKNLSIKNNRSNIIITKQLTSGAVRSRQINHIFPQKGRRLLKVVKDTTIPLHPYAP